jgi:hypothetical protein
MARGVQALLVFMGRWSHGIFVLCISCLAFFSGSLLSAWAQDEDKTYAIYGDVGMGLYGGFGKSNPNYNADGGADLTYNHLFGEFEAGGDTANALDTDNGHTFRTHALLFYRGKRHWSYGGGVHYSEFFSNSYNQHELWPTAALLYDGEWLRANLQYLVPGPNSNYPENGPLVDLRLRLTHGFYGRTRVGIFFYRDNLQYPQENHIGREAFFDILYVFHDKK